jgi:hypothetical protein
MERRFFSSSTEILAGDPVRVNPGGVGRIVHVHIGDNNTLHLFGDAEALVDALSDALKGVQSILNTEEENG